MSNEKTYSEKMLMQLASGGDEHSFTKLYNLYGHKLYSFTLRITESPELAQDIVQNVFLKLWKDRSSLVDLENFGGFIFKMAQNQAINAFKRMANETLILSRIPRELEVYGKGPEENMGYKETLALLNNALKKLPPQQNLVYKLSREQGLKNNEIARLLKISPYTVKNHLVVALQTIGEHLRSHILIESLFLLAIVFQHI